MANVGSSPIIYRASELGGCTKYLMLKRLGYEQMDPPKEFKEKYYDGGKDAEEEVIAKLEEEGEYVLMPQHEVNVEVVDGVIVQGHIDGILAGRVCEIKSMSNGEFEKFRAARWYTPGLVQRYKWQISCYMVGTGFEAIVLVYNRETGELLREGVEVPWYGIDEIRERVLDVECRIETNQIPTSCDIINYPCPFYYLHEEEEVEVDGELDMAAIWYEELREQERQVKVQMGEARERIIALLAGRRKVTTDRSKISLSSVTRKAFDQNKARADGVEVDKYLVESKSERLNVKVEEVADDGERTGDQEG